MMAVHTIVGGLDLLLPTYDIKPVRYFRSWCASPIAASMACTARVNAHIWFHVLTNDQQEAIGMFILFTDIKEPLSPKSIGMRAPFIHNMRSLPRFR